MSGQSLCLLPSSCSHGTVLVMSAIRREEMGFELNCGSRDNQAKRRSVRQRRSRRLRRRLRLLAHPMPTSSGYRLKSPILRTRSAAEARTALVSSPYPLSRYSLVAYLPRHTRCLGCLLFSSRLHFQCSSSLRDYNKLGGSEYLATGGQHGQMSEVWQDASGSWPPLPLSDVT